MPFCRANWKVLLPVWRGLTGAGWDSLARLAALFVCAGTGAAARDKAAISEAAQAAANLEPVKPAAALFFLGGRRLLALGDFGVGIDRLAGIGCDAGAEDAVGEAAVGILDRGALIGIQPGADARIGPLHLGIGQQHLLAWRVIAAHAGGHGLGIGVGEQRGFRVAGGIQGVGGRRAGHG